MKENLMKLVAFCVIGTAFATAWGIQEDPPAGAEFRLEQSQEQVAQQQAYQGRVDASGAVPIRTEETKDVPLSRDAKAKADLSQAERMAQGSANLKAAEERLHNKGGTKSSPSPLWFLALLAGAGLMAYVGVKDWMSKNIPDIPAKRR